MIYFFQLQRQSRILSLGVNYLVPISNCYRRSISDTLDLPMRIHILTLLNQPIPTVLTIKNYTLRRIGIQRGLPNYSPKYIITLVFPNPENWVDGGGGGMSSSRIGRWFKLTWSIWFTIPFENKDAHELFTHTRSNWHLIVLGASRLFNHVQRQPSKPKSDSLHSASTVVKALSWMGVLNLPPCFSELVRILLKYAPCVAPPVLRKLLWSWLLAPCLRK